MGTNGAHSKSDRFDLDMRKQKQIVIPEEAVEAALIKVYDLGFLRPDNEKDVRAYTRFILEAAAPILKQYWAK